jgi:hypothetical protein
MTLRFIEDAETAVQIGQIWVCGMPEHSSNALPLILPRYHKTGYAILGNTYCVTCRADFSSSPLCRLPPS